MSRSDAPTISFKFILAFGVFIFILMYAVSVGLKASLKPNNAERVSQNHAKGKTNGARAYADVEAHCAMGPRVCGTDGAAHAREYIGNELQKAGVVFEEMPFSAQDGEIEVKGVNILAKVSGSKEGVIVLMGHYDTLEIGEGIHFGANTGASNTAILLEMARAFGKKREGREIWLLFLDGHYHHGKHDGDKEAFFGGQAFAAWAKDHAKVDAAVSIEGLGDCYLLASLDAETPAWVGDIFQNIAQRMGYSQHIRLSPMTFPSECTAFREEGIPCTHLQDYSYGGSALEHAQYWLSAQDTPEKVCPQSLQAVGDLLYDALVTIDKRLDVLGGK